MNSMLDSKIPLARRSRWQIDRWLWQWCSAKETLIGFLILVSLAMILSYALPQTPTQVRSDPARYQEWLSGVQARFTTWTGLLDSVGIFYIHDTAWFRVLLGLLALVLLISAGNHVAVWIASTRVRQPEAFYYAQDASSISRPLPYAQVTSAVQQAMEELFGHVQVSQDKPRIYLYGGRAVWTSAGTGLLYLGLLAIVAGVAINGQWGWQQMGVQLLPGVPVSVGPGSSDSLTLIEALPGVGEVTFQAGKRGRISLALGKAIQQRAYRYQLVEAGGPLVEIAAQRNGGDPLTLYEYTARPKPAERLQFTFSPSAAAEEGDHLFIVSEEKAVGRLKWLQDSSPATDEQLFHLWLFHEGGQTLIGEADILGDREITVEIGHVAYTLDISRYCVLNVAHVPGVWAFGLGGVLLVAGLLSSLAPRQQMWSMILSQGDRVQIRIRTRSSGWPRRLQQDAEQVIARLPDELYEYEK